MRVGEDPTPKAKISEDEIYNLIYQWVVEHTTPKQTAIIAVGNGEIAKIIQDNPHDKAHEIAMKVIDICGHVYDR